MEDYVDHHRHPDTDRTSGGMILSYSHPWLSRPAKIIKSVNKYFLLVQNIDSLT